MAKKYEIKTMQKDIEELRKKMGVVSTEPPESLPVAPAPEKKEKKEKKKKKRPINIRKVLIPVISMAIVLLIAGGIYYWWNYMQPVESPELPEEPQSEIPAFLIGADEIEIIESLEINIPTDVSGALGEEYTFFIYSQDRTGFVVKIVNREVNLQDWEETMSEDLEPMFLGQKLGEPATEEFQDNIYKNIDIRYLNFSDPLLTIDYAIVDNYLVITTSKESMYGVIDRVVKESVEAPLETPEISEEGEEEEIRDCGSVINTHIFIAPQNLTTQENDSLKCINEALINCNLSKIEFSGEGMGTYEIRGEEGEDCLISQAIFEPASYKVCKIPMDFIAISKIAVEKENQLDMFFAGIIPFIFTFEKVTDVQTGEVINFECE